MLTYMLFNTQSMLLLATRRRGQADADLHAVQKPEKGCQQAGMANQMMTYMLFKTQSMLLSATKIEDQSHADLHSIQNAEHAYVRNKQEGSQMLTYIL
jgi:hypothetical protein